MIKLETPVFNSGLTITLEGQGKSYAVYLFDTVHAKALNVKQYKDYAQALDSYNTRCTGL